MTLLLFTGGLAMSAFEGNRASTALDAAGLWTVQILMAPLGPLYPLLVPHNWNETIPFLSNAFFYANSVLWGISLAWLIQRRRRAV
jgi:hypothetical protein